MTITPVAAAPGECEKWQTYPWAYGGYDLTAAYICTHDGDSEVAFRFMCNSERTLIIRYDKIDGFEPPDGRDEAEFSFDNGQQRLTLGFVFNEMEYELWADSPINGPIRELLKKGTSLTFSEVGSDKPPLTFSLKGSASALAAVEATCVKLN